jgi:hypothetical protein
MAEKALCTACEAAPACSRGWCVICYSRWHKTGTVERRSQGTLWEILWRKVEPRDDGCWIWTGTITGHGYGYLRRAGKMTPAHRATYELMHREAIPSGLVLDHLCRNRACVNPGHLEPVTHLENVRRGDRPGLRCEHGQTYAYQTFDQAGRFRSLRCRKCKQQGERRRYAEKKAMVDGLR